MQRMTAGTCLQAGGCPPFPPLRAAPHRPHARIPTLTYLLLGHTRVALRNDDRLVLEIPTVCSFSSPLDPIRGAGHTDPVGLLSFGAAQAGVLQLILCGTMVRNANNAANCGLARWASLKGLLGYRRGNRWLATDDRMQSTCLARNGAAPNQSLRGRKRAVSGRMPRPSTRLGMRGRPGRWHRHP